MKTTPQERTQIDQIDDGAWLQQLLADVHEQVARQPSPQAILRIRRRVQAQLAVPNRAAA